MNANNEVAIKVTLFTIVFILAMTLAFLLVNNFLSESKYAGKLNSASQTINSTELNNIQMIYDLYIMRKKAETGSTITVVKGEKGAQLGKGERLEFNKEAYIKYNKNGENVITKLTYDLINASGYSSKKIYIDVDGVLYADKK